METTGALTGLRILEYARLVAGPYCAKLLADLGATVIKVESPGGDPARARGPFCSTSQEPNRSGLFDYVNTSKRSLTLDLQRPQDQQQFRNLLSEADLFIDDLTPGEAESLGLSFDSMTAENPRLVRVSITAFGQTGPYRNYKAYPLNAYQSSGEGYLTPARSEFGGRPPLGLGGFASEYMVGVAAAAASMLGLSAQSATEKGLHVDISKQETLLFINLQDLPRYLNEGVQVARGNRGYRIAGVRPCADGHVLLYYHRPEEWQALLKVIDSPAWSADPTLLDRRTAELRWREVTANLDEAFRRHSKAELLRRALVCGVALAPCRNAQEVLDSEHLKVRGFFSAVDWPGLGKVRMPGRLFRMSQTPFQIRSPAPALSSNALGIGGGETVTPLTFPAREVTARDGHPVADVKRRGPYPLSGVMVLDFTWGWAGPLVGSALGAAGATVIKVESRRRMDFMRQAVDPISGTPAGPNQSLMFNVTNTNRDSVTIDLQHPQGRQLIDEAVAASDIVIESFRPGVAARIGLDYDRLRQLKPDIIQFSFSANGQFGPESVLPGYGPIFAALGGLSEITGYADGPPSEIRAPGDVTSGYAGVLAVLAALRHREQTGEGQSIDCAGQEVMACCTGEALLQVQLDGTVATRRGNQDEIFVPCNCYPTAGNDRWISIVVGSDAEWGVLCTAMDDPAWATVDRFVSVTGRREHEEELDAALSRWTSRYDAHELTQLLQRAGVAAVPSYALDELVADRHIAMRDVFGEIAHEEAGRYMAPRFPWRLQGLELPSTRPAPSLGSHTDQFLSGILRKTPFEIEALRRQGVLT